MYVPDCARGEVFWVLDGRGVVGEGGPVPEGILVAQHVEGERAEGPPVGRDAVRLPPRHLGRHVLLGAAVRALDKSRSELVQLLQYTQYEIIWDRDTMILLCQCPAQIYVMKGTFRVILVVSLLGGVYLEFDSYPGTPLFLLQEAR